MEILPPFVLTERDAIVAEIYEAFAGVSREGGVSWGMAELDDAYGNLDAAFVEAIDQDVRWQDLVPEGLPIFPAAESEFGRSSTLWASATICLPR